MCVCEFCSHPGQVIKVIHSKNQIQSEREKKSKNKIQKKKHSAEPNNNKTCGEHIYYNKLHCRLWRYVPTNTLSDWRSILKYSIFLNLFPNGHYFDPFDYVVANDRNWTFSFYQKKYVILLLFCVCVHCFCVYRIVRWIVYSIVLRIVYSV